MRNDTAEILTIFSPKLPSPGSFFIPYIIGKVEIVPYIIGKVEIERGRCDLGVSVSIMP